MSRRTRVRIATNIYRDEFGFSIIVTRGGDRHPEVRFAPDTPIETLRDERDAIIDAMETAHPRIARGSLADDTDRCLATIPKGHHRATMAGLLEHWARAPVVVAGRSTTLGALSRHSLTPLQIRTQLATFRAMARKDGRPRFAPKTLKELRRALSWVYTTLDGADARNPVRAVKPPRVTYTDPRGIDYGVIERIFAEMPDRGRPQDGPEGGSTRGLRRRPAVGLNKARMRVMAYTGLHQIEVGRLTPRDVDLAGRRLWIHPREKGTGVEGAWHQLAQPAVEALRAFVAAKAFGPFDPRSMARTWRLAVEKAKRAWMADPSTEDQPWPVQADARPYDLRHSVGTAVFLQTGDIRSAQAILRHKQLSTTDRYTRAGVSRRVVLARTALDAHWATVPKAGAKAVAEVDRKSPPMTSSQRPAKTTARRGAR